MGKFKYKINKLKIKFLLTHSKFSISFLKVVIQKSTSQKKFKNLNKKMKINYLSKKLKINHLNKKMKINYPGKKLKINYLSKKMKINHLSKKMKINYLEKKMKINLQYNRRVVKDLSKRLSKKIIVQVHSYLGLVQVHANNSKINFVNQ